MAALNKLAFTGSEKKNHNLLRHQRRHLWHRPPHQPCCPPHLHYHPHHCNLRGRPPVSVGHNCRGGRATLQCAMSRGGGLEAISVIALSASASSLPSSSVTICASRYTQSERCCILIHPSVPSENHGGRSTTCGRRRRFFRRRAAVHLH